MIEWDNDPLITNISLFPPTICVNTRVREADNIKESPVTTLGIG